MSDQKELIEVRFPPSPYKPEPITYNVEYLIDDNWTLFSVVIFAETRESMIEYCEMVARLTEAADVRVVKVVGSENKTVVYQWPERLLLPEPCIDI